MHSFLRSTAAALLIGAAALGLSPSATAAVAQGGFFGDPDTASQYWSEQTYDDCAIMSSAHVIGIVTGSMPDEEDIIDVAASMPSAQHPGSIYIRPADPDSESPDIGGTDAQDLPVLLAQYGVTAAYTDDDVAADGGLPTGMDALEQYLGDGRSVIAMVNANPIWDLPDDGAGAHALVVTGVDADRGIVHLNDSGIDGGADEQVPIAIFQSAWKDMDLEMVVTG
jgi:hypothetical protein